MLDPFSVTAFTPAQAWEMACNLVENCGASHIDERRQLTKEIMPLSVRILRPLDKTIPAGFPWRQEQLDLYARQYLNPRNDQGFTYTYGERIGVQLSDVMLMLRAHPETRRATIVLRRPEDLLEESAPCLSLLDFKIRGSELYTTAIFRSHDIKQAAFANYYGIGRIIEWLCKMLLCKAGPLMVYSLSAHIIIEGGTWPPEW